MRHIREGLKKIIFDRTHGPWSDPPPTGIGDNNTTISIQIIRTEMLRKNATCLFIQYFLIGKEGRPQFPPPSLPDMSTKKPSLFTDDLSYLFLYHLCGRLRRLSGCSRWRRWSECCQWRRWRARYRTYPDPRAQTIPNSMVDLHLVYQHCYKHYFW